MATAELSLQERYGAHTICFGCGPQPRRPAHSSIPTADGSGESWRIGRRARTTKPSGCLNGGIIGTLMDCHSNWTAAYALMQRIGTHKPPTTVTAEYAIKLLQPTPTDGPVHLRAASST
jgi:hypothetical protein